MGASGRSDGAAAAHARTERSGRTRAICMGGAECSGCAVATPHECWRGLSVSAGRPHGSDNWGQNSAIEWSTAARGSDMTVGMGRLLGLVAMALLIDVRVSDACAT